MTDSCKAPENKPEEQARRYLVRSKTTSIKRLSKRDLEATGREYAAELAEIEQLKPRTRSECVDGPRPCPWVSCRYNLLVDVKDNGAIKENLGPVENIDFEALGDTCALDVADRGGDTLEAVGDMLGMTHERIRQLETRALAALKAQAEMHTLHDYTVSEPEPFWTGRRSGR